jgi:hypothetical protein
LGEIPWGKTHDLAFLFVSELILSPAEQRHRSVCAKMIAEQYNGYMSSWTEIFSFRYSFCCPIAGFTELPCFHVFAKRVASE